jgi:hypothetical protein
MPGKAAAGVGETALRRRRGDVDEIKEGERGKRKSPGTGECAVAVRG